LKRELNDISIRKNYKLTTIGIFTDKVVDNGRIYSNELGSFNQINYGGGWNNLAAKSLIDEFSIEPSTPQILILKKTNQDSLYQRLELEQNIIGSNFITELNSYEIFNDN
jgi:hypothetical protein